jgi:hypothetical protein
MEREQRIQRAIREAKGREYTIDENGNVIIISQVTLAICWAGPACAWCMLVRRARAKGALG